MPDGDPSAALDLLVQTVARLHAPAPDGCPWCLEQTPKSLALDLVKEAYEVVDASEGDNAAALLEELGDVLLILVAEAQMANQPGGFSIEDVISGVIDKVVRRHPHVFSEARVSSSDEVLRQWDSIKRAEKAADASILDGIPRALPALLRAEEMQKRAARVGFEWPDVTGVLAKVHEEVDELIAAEAGPAQQEELGDVLFSLVNLSRHLGFSSEEALQQANVKFVRRFQHIEAVCHSRGVRPEELSLDDLDAMWNQAKSDERA